MNAANILKPALSRGEIQVIGATTFNEYRKHIEKDTALERRFQPVTVNEPSMEDTLKILKGIAHYYEAFHGVKIPDGILRQAVVLSERYITDRFLPDKAIDLIDEACSDMNLHDKNINRRMELRPRAGRLRPRSASCSRRRPRDPDFERLAELQQPGAAGCRASWTDLCAQGDPELTMDNLARVIELWTKIPASQHPRGRVQAPERAGRPPEKAHHRAGRGRGRGRRGHPPRARGHQPEAQARELHFRRPHRRGQDGAGQAACRRPFRLARLAHPSRYVGVYGEALRLASRRLPSGLRRL